MRAIAQNMRMDVLALNAVTQSLNRTMSVADTAVAAGTSISDLLKDMKEKALAAKDPSIDANARAPSSLATACPAAVPPGLPSGSTLPHAAAPVQHPPQARPAVLRAALAGGHGAR